jgi:riboflavin kinase
MQGLPKINKRVLFNIDTVFDFYSVLFSVYRGYFSNKNYDIQKLKSHIEGHNLEGGLKNLLNNIPNFSNKIDYQEMYSDIRPYIDEYFVAIKPVIGSYTTITNLAKHKNEVAFYTRFEPYLIDLIKLVHKEWFNYDILYFKEDLKELLHSKQEEINYDTILIESNPGLLLNLKKQSLVGKAMLMINSKNLKQDIESKPETILELEKNNIQTYAKFQDINWKKYEIDNDIEWLTPEFIVNSKSQPTNEEFKVWRNIVKLSKPFEITSKIIHGFGRGSKSLGCPTANLDITEEIAKVIEPLMTGIYCGYASFILPASAEEKLCVSYEKKYKMVMSIGFNPYYDNKFKTAEVHLIDSFDGDFYNEVLKVEIHIFIRHEADFLAFENLIAAIHNDIQLSKEILS